MKPNLSHLPERVQTPVLERESGSASVAGAAAAEDRSTTTPPPAPTARLWGRRAFHFISSLLQDRKKLALSLLALVSAGILVTALITFFVPKKVVDKADQAVMTVTLEPAQQRSVLDTISVTGSVTAWDPLTIGAEVSGLRIASVDVEEGDSVKNGQVLARLNSALLEAQLVQAKARLASGHATLKKAYQPNRPEQIEALKAALQEAEANTAQEDAHLKQTKINSDTSIINANRYGKLAQIGAVSTEEAETKRALAATSQDDILASTAKMQALRSLESQARQRLIEAQRGGRSEDIDISHAAIAETAGQIQLLEQQIAQTIITAPDDGLISKRDAHLGDIASSGTPLFSLIRKNRLELKAQATDIDLTKFQVGQDVLISTTQGDPGKIVGKVFLVSPQVDPITRLGLVRIQLPADSGLKPGMFVRGEVQLSTRTALTVPEDALVTRNGQSFVFTLNGDRALSHPVKLGYQSDTFVEITEGLSPNDKVIVKGARFLADRDVVRLAH